MQAGVWLHLPLCVELIIFARCYHHFFNIPQLTSLISLAATLANDLRIMKAPTKDSRGFFDAAIRESMIAKGQCIDTLKPAVGSVRLIEERRAALGHWFLTSV